MKRLLILLAVVFTGCGDDPVAPEITGPLTGAWTGALPDATLDFTISHHADNNGLVGMGTLALGASTIPVTVNGAYAPHPNFVTLLFVADGQPIAVTGVYGDSVIVSDVHGYGYVHRAVRFRRKR